MGRLQQNLAAVKSLRPAGRRVALDAAQPQHGLEGLGAEPALAGLGGVVSKDQVDLAAGDGVVGGGGGGWGAGGGPRLGGLLLGGQGVGGRRPGHAGGQPVGLGGGGGGGG